MIGLGTIINCVAIIVGGIVGLFFGKMIKDRIRETLVTACGISVIFMGIAGAMTNMLSIVDSSKLESGKTLLIFGSIALGGLVGEIINIEKFFERFAEWLKVKTGNANDNKFIDGFLTATYTVCIGAMAIVGAMNDGMFGDISVLVTKAILDMIFVMVMAGSLGAGCIFSFIPVFLVQGSVTLLAKVIQPYLTEAAIFNISLIGSVLIFCVGLNLIRDKKIRIANLLPALIFAVIAAFLPI